MYKIRAAQIDLNRQKEPMEVIKSFMDFISENGYNTLILYIAWRVKIKSHPWPSAEEAYTSDEIREMVSYAKKKGLDIIPTTNLTYITSLFKYDEMKKYGENGSRFWGSPRGNFCFSNPEAIEFMEEYLKELAELVPSKYLHIGGDEAWDVGFCDKCKGNDFSFEKEEKLYLDFILKCYDIVKNKINRRMIMWDDMFEYYPDILSKMPTDIIMAHWQYQRDVYCSVAHFGNRKRTDTLEEYDRLGFEYLISPATYSTCNGRSFTEHAEGGKNLLGGIMTTWCTHLRFMYKVMPTIASIGRYWENGGKVEEAECFRRVVEALFGTDSEILTKALRSFTEEPFKNLSVFSEANMLTFDLEGMDYSEYARNDLILSVIREFIKKVNILPGKYILEEILLSLELERAVFEVKKGFKTLIETGKKKDELIKTIAEIQDIADEYSEKWALWRPGIYPDNIQLKFNEILSGFKKLAENVSQGNFLKVMFCLPNAYGVMQTKISIRTDEGEKLVGQGVFKGASVSHTFYERIFLLEKALVPKTVLFETRGYGGQGLAYVSAKVNGKSYVPERIVSLQGKILNADYILENDCKWCFMGEADATKAWRNRSIADQINAIEIRLF
ncbi:MAG: hypothetical protein A2017_16515 [Lentisphaerae bacterium GWF2_44_16]|nr:MAG: hypothetical protein A2017_16515 [Lentisphaerae bacterium GWF2_44_16]